MKKGTITGAELAQHVEARGGYSVSLYMSGRLETTYAPEVAASVADIERFTYLVSGWGTLFESAGPVLVSVWADWLYL